MLCRIKTPAWVIVFVLVCVVPLTTYAEDLVNINTADSETLKTLTGIGPSKAAAIITYRNDNGPFGSIEDIQNVSGIGPATYADIEAYITVDGGVSQIPDTPEEPTDTTNNANIDTKSSDAGGSKKEPKIPIRTLTISAPKQAYVDQPVEFDVTPSGSQDRLVRYSWSFGDASSSKEKSPMHTYHYPGNYVVMVESYYAKKVTLARREMVVLPSVFSIGRGANGDILINNDAQYEIDISDFMLFGDRAFTIPDHTVLLAQSTLTIPHEYVEDGREKVVSLADPVGVVVAADAPYTPHLAAVRTRPEMTSGTVLGTTTTAQHMASAQQAKSTSSPVTQQTGSHATPSHNLAYLGLVGVLLVGTIGVFVRNEV